MIYDWPKTGLVPTTNMLWWNHYDSTTSTSGNINDSSGNGLHLVQVTTPPTLTLDLLNGQPGWYFDNSANALITASSSTVTPKHVFILASHEDASFAAVDGLISGKTSGEVLYSDATGTTFDDPGSGWAYTKSKEVLTGTPTAPMSGVAELMEVTNASGIALDGFLVGRRKADTATKWKGWFFDTMAFSSVQTGTSLDRIYMYYAYRYGQWRRGVDLYFPDSATTGIARNRFYEEPKDWDKVTDSYEFEDGGKVFNTIADDTTQRWEYVYQIHYQSTGTVSKDPEQLPIFEQFANEAKRHVSFTFRDKYGTEHTGCRLAGYSRSHTEHKPWQMDLKFDIVKHPGS